MYSVWLLDLLTFSITSGRMEEDAEGTPNRRQFSILFSILFSIFWYRLSIDKYKHLNDDITFLRMEEGAEGTPNRRQLALPWIWWWGSSFQPTHPPRLKRSAPPSFGKVLLFFYFSIKNIKILISEAEGPACLKRSAPSSFVKVLVNLLYYWPY